jgi:hypothetical protein
MFNKLIIICIIGLTILFAGCADTYSYTESQYSNTNSQDQNLIDEYNAYINTFNYDVIILNEASEEWNSESTITNKDNRVSYDEFNVMRNIAQENLYTYQLTKNHRTNFYNFIVNNEKSLKRLGIDAYTMKNTLSDSLIYIETNYQIMANYLESGYYYEYSYESTSTSKSTTTTTTTTTKS